MDIVLAAVDDSAAARAVLAVAVRIAPLLGAEVEALHVREDGPCTTAVAVSSAAGVALRQKRGDPTTCIVEAAAVPEVRAVAVGCRGLPGGRRPAGHVALELICALGKPVVVVPPAAAGEQPLRRLLVPLDGTGATTRALSEVLGRLEDHDGFEVVALHVLEPDRLPAFGDQWAHEAEAWAREFLDRFAPLRPEQVRLELRVGEPAETVGAVATEVGADLVAVGWKRDLAPGRAAVVRTLLARSLVPVLLLPVVEVAAAV